jgi:hypothetical protein
MRKNLTAASPASKADARKYLHALAILTLILLLFGVSLVIATVLFAGFDDGAFSRRICFQRECVKNVLYIYKAPVAIASGTLTILSSVATVGGIFVALQSYVANVRATAFSNHISQLNAFLNYISVEISKRPRIAPQSVDSFYWYRTIFADAGRGDLEPSDHYANLLKKLAAAIEVSNDLASHPSRERFRFVEHQNRLIEALSGFGISMIRQSRLEFFEIEGQVLSMLSAVNFAFCSRSDLPPIPDRKYL